MGCAKNIPEALPSLDSVPFLLERPRIHSLLARAMENHVLLVSAGAGCGKTCAVKQFLQRRPETIVWVEHSEQDNQSDIFWQNFSNAIGRGKPAAGKELLDIGFPETDSQIAALLDFTRRELFGVPGKYVIVGDNFHCIRNPAVLHFFEKILNAPVSKQTLILICRHEPSLNLLPLLSRGLLTRIGAEELLFTKDELADYFNLRNIDLPPEEIEAIHGDTEGWPAALEMAVQAVQRGASPGTFCHYQPKIFQNDFFKKIENDCFTALPAEMRNFIVKLSLFENWPLDLLEAVAVTLPGQYREPAALLSEFEKLNALIRYDFYLRTYRVHRVFLGYLREKQPSVPMAEIQEMSGIAARWYLGHNLKIEALLNFERAMDCQGIAGIADTLPRYIPKWAAAPLLEIIERLVSGGRCSEADGHFLYLRYVVRARLLRSLDRQEEAAALFRENTRHFENLPKSPATLRILAESWNYLGIMALLELRYNAEGSRTYIRFFERANEYYAQNPYPLPAATTVCNVGSFVNQIAYPAGPGEFEQKINEFASSIPKAAQSINGYLSGMSELARTELAYYQGDLNAAEQYARRVVFKAREKNQYEIENQGLFFLMRLCLHRGAVDGLLELLKQRDALLANPDYFNRTIVNEILDGWLFAQIGRQHRIAPWLRGQSDDSDLFSTFRNYETLIKAKYLYAEKKYAETIAFLNLEKSKTGLGSFLLGVLEMNCLEAVCRYRLGDEAAALELLEQTWLAASPNSLNMPFIELGNNIRPLIQAAIAAVERKTLPPGSRLYTASGRNWLEEIRSLASAYGKNLLAVYEQLRNREISRAAVYLTRQERAVLNGLSRGQTRQEIAKLNAQSMSAVKDATRRIYEKLGAVNRADAIRIASSMGLLTKTAEKEE